MPIDDDWKGIVLVQSYEHSQYYNIHDSNSKTNVLELCLIDRHKHILYVNVFGDFVGQKREARCIHIIRIDMCVANLIGEIGAHLNY